MTGDLLASMLTGLLVRVYYKGMDHGIEVAKGEEVFVPAEKEVRRRVRALVDEYVHRELEG